MTNKLVLLGFMALTATIAPQFAKADDCVLPVCNMQTQIAEFKAMKENRKFSLLEQLVGDYRDNTDAAIAANLIEFTKQAAEILKTANAEARTLSDAAQLLEQAYSQQARFAELSANLLEDSFAQLTTGAGRYAVISFWTGKLADLKDVGQVKQLIRFFAIAQAASTAAKDDEYIAREAGRGIDAGNKRVIDLEPTGPSFDVPVADINKAFSDFSALAAPERFVLIRSLNTRFAASTDSAALKSLVDYSKGVADILKGADDSMAQVVSENTKLFTGSLDLLLHQSDISADDMTTYFKQLTGGAAARYAIIQYWGTKIAPATDPAFLRKLAAFFGQASAYSVSAKDDEFVYREASRQQDAVYQRIIAVEAAPGVSISDLNAAVETFRGMDIADRFLVLKKLTDDNAASTDSRQLALILDYAKAATDIVVAAGAPQAFIKDKADALVAQTLDLLTKSGDLSADDLVTYFKQLNGPLARMAAIQYWGGQIATTESKAGLQRLVRFFSQGRRISNAAEDDDYVPREAQLDEKRAREKLATVK